MGTPGRRPNSPPPQTRGGSGRAVAFDGRGDRGQSVVEFALVLPIMVILLFAIIDFARIYTTMLSVESAAREAADYGTTLGAGKWQDGTPVSATLDEMERRACVASSNLSDYTDPDGDPATGNCTNPAFDFCVQPTDFAPCDPFDPTDGCEDPLREPPCRVKVTLTYEFHVIAPVNFQIMGASIGLPSLITVERDSTFAITDIDLASPAP